ncbi:MAG: stage III sporulation protein AC [Acutalibacteraceae bacterium]|nr:stage III sporulation protein AC [Clostridiaceae bacterium]MDY5889815.1 stage III sporulation protein AC [Oscillospiraceae bacterium]MEE1247593.1 stage III sporulation protein AC [Acutalibacteraceae bacterium]MDD6703434.1 stage III sporulation protein AC [Clostridiaceae bacterium]MDD7615572.1 stage III sporulation protein AC [Clostridiaceae bacterium]
MELVIKIAAVGIIVAVLQQILSRSGRDEYAMLVVLAGLIAVVAMLIPELKELYSSASSVFGM